MIKENIIPIVAITLFSIALIFLFYAAKTIYQMQKMVKQNIVIEKNQIIKNTIWVTAIGIFLLLISCSLLYIALSKIGIINYKSLGILITGLISIILFTFICGFMVLFRWEKAKKNMEKNGKSLQRWQMILMIWIFTIIGAWMVEDGYNGLFKPSQSQQILEDAAMQGDYQAQRNLAFSYSRPFESRGEIENPILACAWRLIILHSGSPKVDLTDQSNMEVYCGKLSSEDFDKSKRTAIDIMLEMTKKSN